MEMNTNIVKNILKAQSKITNLKSLKSLNIKKVFLAKAEAKEVKLQVEEFHQHWAGILQKFLYKT